MGKRYVVFPNVKIIVFSKLNFFFLEMVIHLPRLKIEFEGGNLLVLFFYFAAICKINIYLIEIELNNKTLNCLILYS